MKFKLTFLIAFFFSLNFFSQNEDYEKALEVVNSEYVKNKFPEYNIKIESRSNIPDTIKTSNQKIFRLLQFVQKRKQGKLEGKRAKQLFELALHDKTFSEDELLIINALNIDKSFVVSFNNIPTFSPTPIKIDITKDENAIFVFNENFKNGLKIDSIGNLFLFFEKDKNAGENWIKFYNGTNKEKELAISFLIVRNYESYIDKNSKKFKIYENYVRNLKTIFFFNTKNYKENMAIVKNILEEQYKKHRVGLNYVLKEL